MTRKQITCIVSLLLLVIVRDAITLDVEPSSDAFQGDRQDEREDGHLTDEDSSLALERLFIETKQLLDEDIDPTGLAMRDNAHRCEGWRNWRLRTKCGASLALALSACVANPLLCIKAALFFIKTNMDCRPCVCKYVKKIPNVHGSVVSLLCSDVGLRVCTTRLWPCPSGQHCHLPIGSVPAGWCKQGGGPNTAPTVANGEVRLEDDGTPKMYMNNRLSPICGHWFWNNQNGAKTFCKKLGYANGRQEKLNTPYSEDAIQVGSCNEGEPLTSCTGGCNDYGVGNIHCAPCQQGQNVKIRITCDGGQSSWGRP